MFNATVTATVDQETGERGIVAQQTFANILDADKFACVQAHGVPEAAWEITAVLPLKKACSTIMASRNRHIGVWLAGGGANGTGAYHYLKAPGTCEALRTVVPAELAEEPVVELRINATHLFAAVV